jgi:hypothetical protein
LRITSPTKSAEIDASLPKTTPKIPHMSG